MVPSLSNSLALGRRVCTAPSPVTLFSQNFHFNPFPILLCPVTVIKVSWVEVHKLNVCHLWEKFGDCLYSPFKIVVKMCYWFRKACPPCFLPVDMVMISNVNDTKMEVQMFDIEANYRNETKTFWCVPKKESRTFLFNPKTLNQNQKVLMYTRIF